MSPAGQRRCRSLGMLSLSLVAVACAASLCGCRQLDRQRLEMVSAEPGNRPEAAERLYQHGMKLLAGRKVELAEEAFLKAVRADRNHVQAHNNLGLLLFERGELYPAALEFDAAIQLAPQRPEAHNNLGLALETAGKLDEAVGLYLTAHEIEPDNPEYLGNLLRAQIRRGDNDDAVRAGLNQLVFLDRRGDWIEWAEEQLAVLLPKTAPRDDDSTDDPSSSDRPEELVLPPLDPPEADQQPEQPPQELPEQQLPPRQPPPRQLPPTRLPEPETSRLPPPQSPAPDELPMLRQPEFQFPGR